MHAGLKEIGQPLASRETQEIVFPAARKWQHRAYMLPWPTQHTLTPQKSQTGMSLPSPLQHAGWRLHWGGKAIEWLGEHCMFDHVVVPGAFHLCTLLSHITTYLGWGGGQLRNISFIRPLLMRHDENRCVTLTWSQCEPNQAMECGYDFDFQCPELAVSSDEASVLSSGVFSAHADGGPKWANITPGCWHAWVQGCLEVDVQDFYQKVYALGLQLGPLFRRMDRLCLSQDQCWAFFHLFTDPTVLKEERWVLEPGVLDSCFQALFAAYWQQCPELDVYIPLSVDNMLWRQHEGEGGLWGMAELTRQYVNEHHEIITGHLTLYDEQGRCCAKLEHVQLKRARREALLRSFSNHATSFFCLHWQEHAPFIPAESSQSFGLIKNTPYASELGTALSQLGHQVHVLETGQDIASGSVKHVVYGPPPYVGTHPAWAEEIVSTLTFLQQWVNACLAQNREDMHLWIVTSGVYDETPTSMPAGIHAALAAALRVLQREHPHLQSTVVDLSSALSMEDQAWISTWASVLSSKPREPLIRIAHDVAYTPEIRSYTPMLHDQTKVTPAGRYLITGGYSEIGRALMRALIADGAQHITLMARNIPSDTLVHEVEQLKKQGVKIHLFQGDVSIAEDVSALMRHMQRQGQPLKGIYHLAGVLEDGMLIKLDSQALRRVLAPKVQGTWLLHQATQDQELDCFVVYSSLSASIGIPGQSAYAAANAFVEAVMRHRVGHGLPGLAIAWGPWQGGMSGRLSEEHQERMREMGLNFFQEHQVVAGSKQLSACPQAHVFAVRSTLSQLRSLFQPHVYTHRADSTLVQEKELMPSLDHKPVPHEREVMTRLLMEELSHVVRHPTLDARTALTELQLDSLAAVAVVQRIRARTHRALAHRCLF